MVYEWVESSVSWMVELWAVWKACVTVYLLVDGKAVWKVVQLVETSVTELEAQLEQMLGERSAETLVQRLGGLLASSLEALPVEKMWVCWWGSQAEAVYW